nr:S-adenosylmethionine synthase-like [Chlorocebus sabaeus]
MLPIRVHTIVITAPHDEEVCLDEMRDALKEKVIKAIVPAKYLDKDTIYHLQPSGRLVIDGALGDTGLYNWTENHCGHLRRLGCSRRRCLFMKGFYTKVNRSVAYAAHSVAKSLVTGGLCRRILVRVYYSTGVSHPLSISVFHYGTSQKSERELLEIVKKNFSLHPRVIVRDLDLKKPEDCSLWSLW